MPGQKLTIVQSEPLPAAPATAPQEPRGSLGAFAPRPRPAGMSPEEHKAQEIARMSEEMRRIVPLPMTPGLSTGSAASGPVGPIVRSAGQRVVAGAKALASGTVPIVKYELAKEGLEMAGVPAPVATVIAAYLSGKGSAKPASAPEPAAAAPLAEPTPASAVPAAPAASTPAAPASRAVAAAPESVPTPPQAYPSVAVKELQGETLTLPPAQRTPGQMSPAWVQSDLALVAKRARLTLTEAEYSQAEQLVRQGRTPAQAVAQIQLARPPAEATPAPQAPQPEPSQPAASNIPSTPDEVLAYGKLRHMGKTHQQAMKAIEQQRALAGQFGSPTPAQVRERVTERNATGRWPDETK
jgi:hypothetical protein